MAHTPADTLNGLLKGELSAVETYQQAMDKFKDTKGLRELTRIRDEHRNAASTIREHIHQHGVQPEKSSGAWGTFARAVEGGAKFFGNDAALKALKEGEQYGIKAYEKALKELPDDCKTVINSILPQEREHVPVLDRLMAGLVERISAHDAHRRLAENFQTMLVCAYDDREKFEQHHLDGAIPLDEFKSLANTLAKDRELIFYCA